MGSIVRQLQEEALNPDVRTSTLLRKALVVASKLGLSEFERWVNVELRGYATGTEIPEYRWVRGRPYANDPHNGWIPIYAAAADIAKSLSKVPSCQSISELECFGSDRTQHIYIPFPIEVQHDLRSKNDIEGEIALHAPGSAITRILDAVRTNVLNWALKLEADGILGEGLSFSADERRAASSSAQQVNYFYGGVHGSQLQLSSPNSVQTMTAPGVDAAGLRDLLADLRDRVSAIELSARERAVFDADANTIEVQAASPAPKPAILVESLRSMRAILEKAAGTAVGKLMTDAIDAAVASYVSR
ncbi:MAG: hypothetical protein EPO68_15645 [Planctomycetota bacterium]|nr:MAG: hypothetical protein EPO68_15645 [Planctomycetota bacterium]